jgi:large-conductance mechanosensitive channel
MVEEVYMFNIVLAIVFGLVGIALGVGYNFLVIKHYPETGRKGAYVLTVFLFLICALVLFCVVSVRPNIHKAIAENMANMEQYINETHASNGLVKNGLDLKKIGTDSWQIQRELKSLLPTAQQVGLPKLVYDIVVDNALKELGKKLSTVNIAANEPNSFANEDNVLTVASLTNGIQKRAISLVNIIFLVIAAIFAVLLIIYIIKSLLTAQKAQKSKET